MVDSSGTSRRSGPAIQLLAWISLLLAALVWIASLADSLQRPSVGNALEQRQLELEILASRGPAANLFKGLGVDEPERKLLQTLADSEAAGSSPILLNRALLETELGQREAAQRHLRTVASSGPAELQQLSRMLLDRNEKPLPSSGLRPAYRLLSCTQLQRPLNQCLTAGELNRASWRLAAVNLLPLLGVIVGVVMLLQVLWSLKKGDRWPPTPLHGPPLNLTETALLIAGGFVVLGEVITPLVSLPLVNLITATAPLQQSPRAALQVLLLYSLTAVPALVLLALLLRQRGPRPQSGWLQWRPAAISWSQALRGLLMSLPVVALLGWLVQLLWPSAGGSNPLLEQVLDGGSPIGLLLLALTATVLAPFFEELLFRGLLLPVVGQRWGAAAGISVSAVVFSLAHLSLSEALPLLGLGVGLGLVRWRSGRLFSCAVMHGLWNGLTFTNLLLLGS
jgi:membrane protease YdiL (CAAX protease family)